MVEAPAGTAAASRTLVLTAQPPTLRVWWDGLWQARHVLATLARADFKVRYKRAAFGVAWAVVIPVLQATVLAVIFVRIIRFRDLPGGEPNDFGAYVIAAMLSWSYFAQTIGSVSTAIVDASGLTDKVWFPRAILALAPVLANLPGFVASLGVLVVVLPMLGSEISMRLLLLPAAVVVLCTFVAALGLVLSALHVYFRDTRFLVQASLLLLFWLTPIAYPKTLLQGLAPWLDANPMTGVVTLFRMSTVGHESAWQRPVAVTVGVTGLLLVTAAEVYRRHDRKFVDLL